MASVRWALFRPHLSYPSIPYHELLRRSVERRPDAQAIVFEGRTLTFRELEAVSNALAHGLRSLGLAKGERVALFMTNRPEYVVSFQAVSKAGGVVTPINPSYHEPEVRYQVQDAEASILIVHQDRYPVVERIRNELPSVRHVCLIGEERLPGTVSWDDLVTAHPADPPAPVPIEPERDLLALPYSSGTTGLPKGVMLTHRNLVANNIQCTSAGRLTDRDVLLLFLPFYHIYGTMLMGAAVASGATQVIMERFELLAALSLVERYRVTLFYAVPPVLLAFTQFPDLKKYDLSSIRYIMSGAAPLPPEVGRRVHELTGVRVLQGYGLTEASPLTHLNPVDCPEGIRMESVGFRVSDQEEKIVDPTDDRAELGPGETGELLVRGPHVMQGYWKAPEETARTLAGGWLHTGDIARRDADGYVYIVDRKKEMIKYKGFGIAPAELEAVLHEHPAVADCAVVPKPDPEAGEIPQAFVVRQPGSQVTADELMHFVEQRVAGYKKIRAVAFVDEIPKNPSGKILRRVLKERT